MEGEVWKKISGFEGYELSNFGRVRSWWKTGPRARRISFFKILKCPIRASRKGCQGYRMVVLSDGEKSRSFYLHRLLWEIFKGPIPEKVTIDHIDGNSLNNCSSNLRLASFSQNNCNRKGTGKGKFKGAYFIKANTRTPTWEAKIAKGKIKKHLGYFSSEIETALAYDKAAKEFFGEFAYQNFPGEVLQ